MQLRSVAERGYGQRRSDCLGEKQLLEALRIRNRLPPSITRRLRPDHTGMERPRPLTTPAVTETESPSGLPTAMTSCPTLRATLSVKSVVVHELVSKFGPGRGEARVQLPALHGGDPDPLQLDAFGVADDGFEGLHYAHRDRGVGPVPDVEH